METLSAASERGLSRPDIIPGLRVIGFGRTTIAVVVEDDVAVVIRVFHGGQDWERALKGDDT